MQKSVSGGQKRFYTGMAVIGSGRTLTGLKIVELSLVILEHLKGDFRILLHVISCHLMSREFLEGVCKVATNTRNSASIESI